MAGKGSPKGVKQGGRKPGTLNKATAEIKALAQQYAPDALKELARLATGAESEQARVAAIKEILDRGYGKAPQAIEHSTPEGGAMVIEHRHRISSEIKQLMAEEVAPLGVPSVTED